MSYNLIEVIVALDQMLQDGIVDNYAIGGAIAASFYGEVATTEDVDVFVVFKPGASSILIDPRSVIDYFLAKGHSMMEDKIVIGGWPVQFLPPPSPLEEEALARAVDMQDEDLRLRLLSREYVAAIALNTGRAKDRNRLIQLREEGELDMQEFRRIVSAHGLSAKWKQFEELFPLET
jgi:hypothetical protein